MAMDVVTLGILLKKINDSLSGISNVSYNVATNEFEFTNATTGQVFAVTIPNMHQHTNSSILSLLDIDANGSLTFNGIKVAPDLTPTQIDELKDIVDTILKKYNAKIKYHVFEQRIIDRDLPETVIKPEDRFAQNFADIFYLLQE